MDLLGIIDLLYFDKEKVVDKVLLFLDSGDEIKMKEMKSYD